MRKVIIISIVLLSIISCRKEYWTSEKLIIKNFTSHTIELSVYSGNKSIYHIMIPNDSRKVIDNSDYGKKEFSFFPFKHADSVIVNYDNSYNIIHYRSNNGSVKSILLIENWKKIINKINEDYEYEYIFDN